MAKFKSKGSHRIRFTRRNMLLVALVLVLAVGGSAFAYTRLVDEESSATTGGAGSQPGYVNLDPPTEEEKQESEAHKQSLANDQGASTPTTPSGKKQVTPVITSASRSEVNAYVSGVFEDGGTCTATATKDSQTITKDSTGFTNVSYTSCPPIQMSLPAGTWSVVVSYSS